MTEVSSERIKPPRAAYKETPYESPARLGNGAAGSGSGTGEASPFYDKPSPLIKSIEEAPRDTPSALIDASRKVYAAVTQRIASLETELKELRSVAASFAALSRQNDAPRPASMEDGIRALLDIADKLPQTGEQSS